MSQLRNEQLVFMFDRAHEDMDGFRCSGESCSATQSLYHDVQIEYGLIQTIATVHTERREAKRKVARAGQLARPIGSLVRNGAVLQLVNVIVFISAWIYSARN